MAIEIRRVKGLYFSPCGSTERIASIFGNKLAENFGIEYTGEGCSLPEQREKIRSFSEDEICIIATPVYAGRVPNKILDFWKNKVKAKICIALVVYGNRSEDFALAELVQTAKDNGAKVPAALSLVAEHVFSDKIATGRPDKKDIAQIEEFARKVAQKLKAAYNIEDLTDAETDKSVEDMEYYAPKKTDGKTANFLKIKPKVDPKKCTHCGVCVQKCPMGSIYADLEKTEVRGVCIKCMACVKYCKQKAMGFEDGEMMSHIELLEQKCKERKEGRLFI